MRYVVVSEANDHGTSERRPTGAVRYVDASTASGYEKSSGDDGTARYVVVSEANDHENAVAGVAGDHEHANGDRREP